MAFKIKDGVRIGDIDVLNNEGQLLSPKIRSDENTVTIQPASLTEDRTLTIPDVTGTLVTTGDSGSVTSDMIVDGTIVNADINASAAIVDVKLDTISTANKVSISALNIASATDIGEAIVDGDLIIVDDGADGTLRKSTVNRIPPYVFTKVSGDIVIDSSGVATIQADSVALGTDTTGNYVATITGTANQVSISGSGSESAAVTLSLPQDIATSSTPTFAGMTLTGNLSMSNTGKIVNLAAPTADSDAATKLYVDEVAQGIVARSAAEVLVSDNLVATYDNGTSGVGATLTDDANGAFPTIDGVTLTETMVLVLVTGQTNKAHNGLYVLTTLGDSSNPWVLTRSSESDTAEDIEGSFVFIKQGTEYSSSGFVATVTTGAGDPGIFEVGVDEITWVQFSGAGTYQAGTGLTLDGNSFSVNENLSHVTGLGTITSGTWQASVIDPTYGGTGVDNGSSTITLGGSLTTSGAHTLTLSTTDNTSLTLPVTGTVAVTGDKLSAFATTSSTELAGVISDETGSGKLVFGTSPTFTTSVVTDSTSLSVFNSTATTVNAFGAATAVNIGAGTGTTTVNNSLVVSGDLTVSGTTTTINSETVTVKDINIELGNVDTPTNATANGGGITLLAGVDGNKTFEWTSTGSNWSSSENISVATGKEYKINNVGVLSSTELGSTVVSSSLTSVGTVSTGTWEADVIAPTYGGTGVNNGTNTITLGGNLTTSGAFNTTFNVTGNTTVTLPTSGTLATTGKLDQFAATTSAEFAGVISDETGSGQLVFNTSPSFVSSITTTSETFALLNTTATTVNAFGAATAVNIGAETGTTTVNNNLTIAGDLIVQGATTTLNTSTLQIEDKNIEIAKVTSPTDTTADGAGITVKGTSDKTFNWINSTDSWTSSEHLNLASGKEYKLNGNTVLTATSLGTSIVSSSLTSVGTITSGTWNGTAIAVANGGTGATTESDARSNLGASTVGSNLFTLSDPSSTRFLRTNSDNTVSALTAEEFRNALGAGSEATTSVSSTDPTAVDNFSVATYRSAKYVVQITQGTNYQVSEILVIHDGTTTYMTEYAVLETNGSLATFTSDISGGNARLLVTMSSASAATVKLDRTSVTV